MPDSPTVDALRAAFTRADVARLGTVDDSGRPNLVPICFALSGTSLYTAVDGKPKRSRKLKRLENIRAHPAVSVLVDHYEDDWSQLWWIVAEGRAEIVDDEAESATAIGLLSAKYAEYEASPPAGPVIAVRVERWRSWSAESGSATRTEAPAER